MVEITEYFRHNVLENPERAGITQETCERIVEEAEYVERQPNGRFAFWGRPPGKDLYPRVIVTGDRRALDNAFFDTGFSHASAASGGESMKVSYYPDTDSLFVKLKPGTEVEGTEVAPGIVFHYTPEGEVAAIDIDSAASKLVDLSLLEVDGLPISVRLESKAG